MRPARGRLGALLLPLLLAAGCAAPRAGRPPRAPASATPVPVAAETPPGARVGPPPDPRPFPRGEVYAGIAASALPGTGASLHLGQVLGRTSRVTWSFEVEATLQDLEADFGGGGSGSWGQVRGGVKAALLPRGAGHPTARAGLVWFRSTGDTDLVERAGDYVGLYAGLGYEWDVSRALSTGPEASVLVATDEKDLDPILVPQVRWHLVVRF